jgi:hypothetical protein
LATRVLLVVLMRLQDFLAELFLAFVNVTVQFVAIFSNRKFLIVVDRDVNLSGTNGFIVRIVKLRYIRMS